MKDIELTELLRIVCNYYDADVLKVQARGRKLTAIIPRQMYCYLAVEYFWPRLTLKKIGSLVGIDHATVIHHHKKIDGYLPYYGIYKSAIENILYSLKAYSFDRMDMSEKRLVSNSNLGRAYLLSMDVIYSNC